jgi:hypothetical protein
MNSAFLTQLAHQLKNGRNPAQRRAIQRIIPLVTAKFEAGAYADQREAESELRMLVERECLRIQS